ncbi:MAG: insulinase family protein [Deltaproteobacteria bacterium]|nr:insulinase family protein [Deltaproteobacteria bacterium]MBN2670767.1 insulinase family protein [Deltaproteobacteria bacterium]
MIRKRWRIFSVLSLWIIGTWCPLVFADDEGETSELAIAVEKYTLPNGLKVILHENHSLPLVAVNLWYHVGAVNEAKGKSGFAHLFEHLMFQGSGHVADDEHIRVLEQIGASDLNGSTGFDRTNYFQTVPANHLETALWLESDRMGYLLDALTQAKLDNQRDVVKNERRQTTENQPYGLAEELFWQRIFPADHPYYGLIIGSMADLNQASLADVKHFFTTYYSPANATLTVAGDIDIAQVKSLIEKYFGPIQGVTPSPLAPLPPVEINESFVMQQEEPIAPLAKVEVSWITPKAYAPGDAEADILANILSGGKSSLLNQRLMRELEMVQQVSAYQMSMQQLSVFTIEAVVRPGVSPQTVLAEIDNVLASVRAGNVTEELVTRAVNQFETGFFQDLERIGHVADQLQRYNHFTGNPDYIEADLHRYTSVAPEDVVAFANQYLLNEHRAVLYAVPTKSDSPNADVATEGGDQ